MKIETHYEILDMKPTATADEIMFAYSYLLWKRSKKLSDGQGNNPAEQTRTLAITEAGATLRDPYRRAEYDKGLKETGRTNSSDILRPELPQNHDRIPNWGVFEITVHNVAGLLEAVETASPGSTINLRAGTYRLTRPLLIRKSLNLHGEGMNITRLLCPAGCFVARIDAETPHACQLNGISFIYTGKSWSNVVEAMGGVIEIWECSFTGGIVNEASRQGGNGLAISGSSVGSIWKCESFANGANGISLSGAAEIEAFENQCLHNGRSGLIVRDNACGSISENISVGNGQHGFHVFGKAKPALERNHSRANQHSGIFFAGKASGLAKGNVCSENRNFGLRIGKDANPDLESNKCFGNGDLDCFDERTINPALSQSKPLSTSCPHCNRVNAEPVIQCQHCGKPFGSSSPPVKSSKRLSDAAQQQFDEILKKVYTFSSPASGQQRPKRSGHSRVVARPQGARDYWVFGIALGLALPHLDGWLLCLFCCWKLLAAEGGE